MLWLYDSGASTEEIERGVLAALELLEKAGVTPDEAYAASRAEADDKPFNPAHAQAWREAEIAAIDATCAGWARIPESAVLAFA